MVIRELGIGFFEKLQRGLAFADFLPGDFGRRDLALERAPRERLPGLK